MPIATIILTGALAIVAKDPVLDFSKLPQPGGTDYQFAIRLQLANGQVITCGPVVVGGAADPEDVISLAATATGDKTWKRGDGLHLMVKERAGVKITGVTITGIGPKPTVRWALAPPATPKK